MLKRELTLSTRSFTSNKSYKSHKSILTEKGSGYENAIKDFEVCFPKLCNKYGLEREVHVKKEYKKDDYYKYLQASEAVKRRRTIVGLSDHSPHSADTKQFDTSKATEAGGTKETATVTGTDINEEEIDLDAIILAAMYDSYNHFVEIYLYKVDEVPRELIKILTFIARYYIYLRRIKIQLCKKISGATLYEISKLLNVSSITEVDLDGSYCKAGNYGILFDSGRIVNVSLSKCCISDDVCEIIASKMGHKGPAEKSLYSLSLSSNRITDVGAISLAKALRSNRKLRYLNLAANHITDTGAGCILDSLKEFPLSPEEILLKSKRYMEYERTRLLYYWRFLSESDSHNDLAKTGRNSKRKSNASNKHRNSATKNKETKKDLIGSHSQKGISEHVNRSQRDLSQQASRSPNRKVMMNYEDMKNRAQILAGEMVGPFRDPFQGTSITIREGKCYSKGNLSLCYLNLAFNNLGFPSVVKLLDVLKHQKDTKAMGQLGLVRAIIKGNNMPESCEEYVRIDELLTKSMRASGGRAFADYNVRRKSRASIQK